MITGAYIHTIRSLRIKTANKIISLFILFCFVSSYTVLPGKRPTLYVTFDDEMTVEHVCNTFENLITLWIERVD